MNVNYAPLLAQKSTGASLNYFGLYYGSIDTFNDVTFYNAAGAVLQTITGTQLIKQFNGVSGGQDADSSDIYVSLFSPQPSNSHRSASIRRRWHLKPTTWSSAIKS